MNINIKVMLCCVFFSTQSILSVGDFENTRSYSGYPSQQSNSVSAYESMKQIYSILDAYVKRTRELKAQGGNEEALMRLSRLTAPSLKVLEEISINISDILFFENYEADDYANPAS